MKTRPALAAALAITVGASLWLSRVPSDDHDTVDEPVKKAADRVAARAAAPAVPAGIDRRTPASAEWRTAPWPQAGAEALAAWTVPAPAAPARAAAPPPPAPPPPPAFPYQWIGRLDDGEAVQALLSGPTRSFGVRAGEVLDANWRVDRVAAAGLQLTWLPTGNVVHVAAR